MSAVVAGLRLVAVNRETAIAHQAARAMVERMQDTQFADVFATFNDAPGDDPGGMNTAPGSLFAVRGLNLQRGDGDGFAGDVFFPTVTDGAGNPALSEDRAEPRWGMPRDLNGDGAVTAGVMPDRYMILPVRVRVRWTGTGGDRQIELDHVFIAH